MVVVFFLLVVFAHVHAECPVPSTDFCALCPPCASKPPEVHKYKPRAIHIIPLKKTRHRHSSTDDLELQRLTVIRDTDEEFRGETVDLSKYQQLALKDPISARRPGIVENILPTTTKRTPSTIPTATPATVTRDPKLRVKYRTYMKKRKLPKILVTSLDSLSQQKNERPTVEPLQATSPGIEPESVKVVPTGYKTNPSFSPDEVTIENDKCNDDELQKILVEGIRVDDSIMSKRSIGAILSSSHRNHISVLCSDQQVAFRLVARRHCQLSVGKITCVLFIL